MCRVSWVCTTDYFNMQGYERPDNDRETNCSTGRRHTDPKLCRRCVDFVVTWRNLVGVVLGWWLLWSSHALVTIQVSGALDLCKY